MNLILDSTSTLAVGVNLPAHLVIIKSTKMYDNNGYIDYSVTQVMQMIGRAGRPQVFFQIVYYKQTNSILMKNFNA